MAEDEHERAGTSNNDEQRGYSLDPQTFEPGARAREISREGFDWGISPEDIHALTTGEVKERIIEANEKIRRLKEGQERLAKALDRISPPKEGEIGVAEELDMILNPDRHPQTPHAI